MARRRALLVARVCAGVPTVRLIGSTEHRSPANASLSFPGLKAEPILHALEARGVFVSSGSACHASEGKMSHVLSAIGHDRNAGVLRVTLCRDTTEAEIETAAAAIVDVVAGLAR